MCSCSWVLAGYFMYPALVLVTVQGKHAQAAFLKAVSPEHGTEEGTCMCLERSQVSIINVVDL